MSIIQYKSIVNKARSIKKSVETKYELGESTIWGYYIAKAILKPSKDVEKISVGSAPNPQGDYVSDQIYYSDYTTLCQYVISFVEKNKRLPNFITWKDKKIRPSVLIDMLARILVYREDKKSYPKKANINSKAFDKPTETGNVVYDYFVKKTGKKFTMIDDLLKYVKFNFKYQKYFNDYKSNKEVTDTKSGNCTDLLQWLINMATAMGYESRCIHVKCKSSGTGHVFGKFKHPKHTENHWITRDIACVADGGSITCVWCENGYLQGVNPSWFLQNLNR